MSVSPCYHCKKRYSACHDTCKEYKNWSDKERSRRQRPMNDGGDLADHFLAETHLRMRRLSRVRTAEKRKKGIR